MAPSVSISTLQVGVLREMINDYIKMPNFKRKIKLVPSRKAFMTLSVDT